MKPSAPWGYNFAIELMDPRCIAVSEIQPDAEPTNPAKRGRGRPTSQRVRALSQAVMTVHLLRHWSDPPKPVKEVVGWVANFTGLPVEELEDACAGKNGAVRRFMERCHITLANMRPALRALMHIKEIFIK